MNVTIRKATKKDFKVVNELFYALHKHEHDQFDNMLNVDWPNTKPAQRFLKKQFDDPKNAVFVAEVKRQVVGYVFGGRKSSSRAVKPARRFLLDNVYVAEGYRSAGIGTKLMDTFISWAKDNGAEKIKINAFTKNKRAIGLYKKKGFRDSTSSLVLDV